MFDLYKKFLSTDAETLLVLEDDCKFLPSIKQDTKEIFENIHNTEWDLFWVGGINRKPPIFYKNNCYQVSSPSYAQSYIIKRRMAEDVLKYFDPNWCNLGIDEMLCLFAYGYDIAKDPFGNNFYNLDQPLEHFKSEYTCLCYEVAFTTQYNSYSDLTETETTIENWLPLHHPKSKTW
jgi:GR25 family glycosyltransferase involved in LPS biosynthesis